MKKKVTYFIQVIAVILLISFVCGCGTEVEETPNRISASLTRVSKDGEEVSASNSSGTSGNPTGSTTKPSGSATTPSGNTAVAATVTPEVTETTTKNNYVITPVTEGLCEQLPASELGELAAYNAFNRLERNYMTEVMQEHKVCVDDVTGVVYYVNVGRDYFLYRIKDGKSELAVELPANYLYTHEGVLYFLLDAQNILHGFEYSDDYSPGEYLYDKFTFEGMSEGDIYSYTPATGKVELVYPAQALKLKVTDEGIYYLKGQLNKNEKAKVSELEWYYLPFGGTEPEKVDSNEAAVVWNGYRFERSENAVSLVSEAAGDRIEFVQSDNYVHTCIFRDKVFSLNVKPAAIPKCFDLLTKEEIFSCNLEESVATADLEPSGESSFLLSMRKSRYEHAIKKIIDERMITSSSFALTEDSTLWFIVQDYIYSVNMETGEKRFYYVPFTEYSGTDPRYIGKKASGSGFSKATELYTDGNNLYVIRYDLFDKKAEAKLMRLVFEYEEETNIWYWDVTDKIGIND